MIGRGAIGRPWIFKEIRHFLEKGKKLSELSIEEKVNIARFHFKKSLELKVGERAFFEMRRHFALYFKGLYNFKPLRLKLLTSLDENEIFDLLDLIKKNYKEN